MKPNPNQSQSATPRNPQLLAMSDEAIKARMFDLRNVIDVVQKEMQGLFGELQRREMQKQSAAREAQKEPVSKSAKKVAPKKRK